jgi:cobalt/nickel transport protein
MKASIVLTLSVCLTGILSFSAVGFAHFGAVIPSAAIVTQSDAKQVTLAVKFLHPFEMQYMDMARPTQFGVLYNAAKTDLLPTLTPASGIAPEQKNTRTSWKTEYRIKRPGDYTFYVEPSPYWEPAEDAFIIHYTKVCVNALGLEQGWDTPVGLETEIIPKTRPYGLWTGNVFTGQVLVKGKPAADVEVEIEYLNESPDNPNIVRPPSDPYVTQTLKTDPNGMFTYAMPRAGWWGFAALSTADWTLKQGSEEKTVEIGAVYWVHTTDMQ